MFISDVSGGLRVSRPSQPPHDSILPWRPLPQRRDNTHTARWSRSAPSTAPLSLVVPLSCGQTQKKEARGACASLASLAEATRMRRLGPGYGSGGSPSDEPSKLLL